MEPETNIVYVLTNPAMPGLVKIGYTSQQDAQSRIDQLYGTGVPVPFEIEYACRIDKAPEVEKALHVAFSPQRINPKREFFKIEPEQAIAILRVFSKEEVTGKVLDAASTIDPESKAAGEQLRKRRPNMNFREMGIPVGADLHFVDGDEFVVVVSEKKVRLGSEEMSLTAATRLISATNYDLPPALYWTYNGRLLREIYNETYDPVD